MLLVTPFGHVTSGSQHPVLSPAAVESTPIHSVSRAYRGIHPTTHALPASAGIKALINVSRQFLFTIDVLLNQAILRYWILLVFSQLMYLLWWRGEHTVG